MVLLPCILILPVINSTIFFSFCFLRLIILMIFKMLKTSYSLHLLLLMLLCVFRFTVPCSTIFLEELLLTFLVAFCPRKYLIHLYFEMLLLLRIEFWSDSFSSFSTLMFLFYFLLDCIVSDGKSAIIYDVFNYSFIYIYPEGLWVSGCFFSLI